MQTLDKPLRTRTMLMTAVSRTTTLPRALVAALALMLPVSAAAPALGNDTDFDAHFERYDVPPPQPTLEGDVVDLNTIEPPLEIEEEPATTTLGTTLGTGVASYYGRRFHGRRTANGERFDMNAMTAAHKTLPFGSRVKVTNTANGRSVVVRINDRGPYAHGRTIDLSRAAASEIGLIARGHGRVALELL